MGKFLKPGKVVLVLGGKYAGRKAVIIKVKLIFNLLVYEISKMAIVHTLEPR